MLEQVLRHLNTAVGETYAIMGMKLWAEYLDGIAKITVSAGE